MTTRRCDMCQKYMESKDVGFSGRFFNAPFLCNIVLSAGAIGNGDYDLCSKCAEKFYKFALKSAM